MMDSFTKMKTAELVRAHQTKFASSPTPPERPYDVEERREYERCQGCQGPRGEIAPCPFAEELYGEPTPCNCCDECRRACAEEV